MSAAGTKPGILVIKLGALGDFIQAAGAMAAIRRHHAADRVTLLTTRPFAGFAELCGYFDEIIIDEKPGLLDPGGWLALRRRLIAGNFSRVYDLQNNDRTALYLRLFTGARKPEWVGAARGASHRNSDPARTAGHALDGHIQTLELAGITGVEPDPLDWLDSGTNFLGLRAPYVLLVPGSAPAHPHKRWPAAHYGELASMLDRLGYQPVIIGGPGERDLGEKICALAPAALDLTGQTTYGDIAGLARGAGGAAGNDTGPMHLVAATGCPCVVLFSGRSDPARHAPKGRLVKILQSAHLEALAPATVMENMPLRPAAQDKQGTLH